MFDTGFAMLFRAIGRIRVQLERADPDFKRVLAEELGCLRHLGDQYIDHWMSLDEQIDELFDTYELPRVATVAVGEGHVPLPSGPHGPALVWQIPADGRICTECPAPTAAEAADLTADATTAAYNSAASPLPDDTAVAVDADWQALAFDVPDDALHTFRQGMGYYDLLMYDDASERLEATVQLADHPIARIYLAAAHAARGRYEVAVNHIHAVRSAHLHPVLFCATYEVEAQIRLAIDEVPAAIDCLQHIARTMPDYRDVWYNLGICLAHQGEHDAAAKALRRVVSENAEDVMALTALVRVELQRGEVADAAEVCRAGLARYPRHVQLIYAHSHVLEHAGQLAEAARLVREITHHTPALEAPWVRSAWLLLRQQRVDDAIAILKKYLTLCREPKQGILQLGIAHLLANDLDRAEKILGRCLSNDGMAPVAWIALGRISAQRGEIGKAYVRFLRAMRDSRHPIKRLALYYYGVSLAEQGQWAESEKYLKAALHLGSKNAAILAALAKSIEHQGRTLEADKVRSRLGHVESLT